MKHGVMPMAKGHKGMASKSAPARSTKRNPEGTDGIHPMTAATGNKKMSRVLTGVDRKKSKKGKLGTSPKSLEGKWF